MPGILAAIVLTLSAPLLGPTVVATGPGDKETPPSGIERPRPASSLSEFLRELSQGKLTKPGRVIERAGQQKR